MFIHIGNRRIVSDKSIIGIFNTETLRQSLDNAIYVEIVSSEDKTVVIDRDNNVLASKISPFTVIRRTVLEEAIWRRDYD